MRPRVPIVLTALLGALLVAVPAPAAPGAPGSAAKPRIDERRVVFDVDNTSALTPACSPDEASYHLRGRLVGPTADLDGGGGSWWVSVLVHDIGTGGWFWNLRTHPAYDYATQLAKAGQTTLVLDRLGYGASPLADGRDTCVGAHVDMLHQVVQDLLSGEYRYTNAEHGSTPAAAHVVTQGHGVGGLIVQAEAADFDDVDGVVIMSWADSGPTPLAVRTGVQQARDCARSDYAPYAQTASDFRNIMFDSAPGAVQRAGSLRRSEDPCGDVASLLSLSGQDLGAGGVDAPVLLLFGARDKLIRPVARQQQADSYPSAPVMKVFPGTGSSLPLENSAGKVRSLVLRWLGWLQ
ncbi:alpha/beta hydrolase [Nocardioides sp.]|uniref:alpha/beta hydrolase n=1 Tax=Nocardioides sp. TaxID=35761 RepID=UPI0037851AB0